MPLNRDDLLKKLNSRKNFFIKALGDEVLLRELSSKEVLDLTEKHENKEITQAEYTYALLVASVVDENDQPLFTMELAQSLSVNATTELVEVIAEYNGMNVAFDKAKADLKKVRANAS